jgi:hypothetical protein
MLLNGQFFPERVIASPVLEPVIWRNLSSRAERDRSPSERSCGVEGPRVRAQQNEHVREFSAFARVATFLEFFVA